MKVLVLGLPRTGTQSLADALAILGIGPVYHMREVGKNSHQDLWIQAMEAKFEGKGFVWGRNDFEKILAGYEAVADYPASIFPRELIAAYPEALIILSTRASAEKWCESMQATLIHHHLSRPRDDPAPMARLARRYHALCWDDDFARNGKDVYGRHNATVREAAKGRKLLEYRPGDGWGPLCEFLGVRVPEGREFPRSDDWGEYKAKVGAVPSERKS